MPVIDLPEEPPLPGANTLYFPIQSVMLYPRDETKRAQWFAAAMAQNYSSWRQDGASPDVLSDFHGWLGELWKFSQAPRRVFDDGMKRVSRAGLSGHVLIYLLRAARHHPEHCKFERIKAVMAQFVAAQGETVSESLVEKLWPEFKPVAHLWAALDQLVRTGGWVPELNSEVLRFLQLAETYRELGEQARILDPLTTWRAPAGVGRAEEPPTPPLAEDILSFLNRDFPG